MIKSVKVQLVLHRFQTIVKKTDSSILIKNQCSKNGNNIYCHPLHMFLILLVHKNYKNTLMNLTDLQISANQRTNTKFQFNSFYNVK